MIEEDVAAELVKLQAARNEPISQTLNTVLRAGLASMSPGAERKPAIYRTVPVSLGTPRFSNLDDISEVLAFVEG